MAKTSISTSNFSIIEQPFSKSRSKSTMKDTSNVDVDLISRLPDEVLTHILSFIDTKSSVATSVLSKRWNQLWISVPILDFGGDYNGFYFPPEKKAIFANFVDRVLSHNTGLSVRKIRLRYHGVLEVSRLDAWISSIVKRHAIEMDVKLFRLPHSFLKQKNLVELKFTVYRKIPQSVCFPNLKTIHLYHYLLKDDDSMKNLLSGCPVLMNLYIQIYERYDARTLYICSSTLRSLHLLRSTEGWYDGFGPYNVVINAPNVRDLHFVDFGGMSYNEIDVSSLVKLYLLFNTNTSDGIAFQRVANLPMFRNLVHLSLEFHEEEQWGCIPRLLQGAPKLGTFVLLNYFPCAWSDPNEVPHCFLSCLENVEIWIYFEDRSEKDLMMISYILKNANVLKNLSIHTTGHATVPQHLEQLEFVKTLLILPRSSVACQVYYKDEAIEQRNYFC